MPRKSKKPVRKQTHSPTGEVVGQVGQILLTDDSWDRGHEGGSDGMGEEASLPHFEAFREEDPLPERVLNQILVGVSTRNYESSLSSTGLILSCARQARVVCAAIGGWLDSSSRMPGRPLTRSAAAAWSLALLLYPTSGCREPEHPNIVLIVIDTLRRDHVGALGYYRDTTPNLDALAKDATLFTHSVSPSSQTVPVIASLLTGLYPSQTSVHYYGAKSPFDGERPGSEAGPYVDGSLELLSERLGELGYATGAVVSNPWIREDFGFGQGFDSFVPLDCRDLCDGKDVVDEGIRWIRTQPPDTPFFLYLHFMDVHNPYEKPGITRGVYLTETVKKDFYRNGPTPEMPPRGLENMRALYDEGILYVDRQIGRFVERLDELSPPEHTLLVVTSDHGDEFDEHGGLGHGTTLYDELVSSFLLLRYPPRLPTSRIDTPVSAVDVVPTIAELVGDASRDPGAGRSLLGNLDAKRWFVSELGSIKSVRRDGWKLILDIEAGEPQLYHLPTDPGEATNLAEMNPKITREWMRYLSRFVADAKPPSPNVPNEPVNEELRDKLRALGYVE